MGHTAAMRPPVLPVLPVLLVLLVASAVPARAGGFSNLDFGLRRQGMFAVVARPDDGTAIFHNPAGMVLTRGTTFSHHQSWLVGDVRLRFYDSQGVLRPDHEIRPDWNLGLIPFLGAVSDLGTGRWRAGLAVYAPNVYGAALPGDEPTRYHATRVLFLGSRATAAAAWQATDWMAVGLSVSLVHVYLTAKRVLNPLVLADPDARFADPAELASSDYDLAIDGQDFTWAWDAGLLLHPLPSLRLGFSFASGSDVQLAGNVRATAPTGEVLRSRHRTAMTIPFTLSAGLNWEFAPDFELGVDVRYWHYQVLQEQRSVLDTPLLGIAEFRDPKANANSWNWCVGLLYRVIPELDVMLGFQEDFTPTPDAAYTLDNLSRDQFGVSTGLRWRISPHWRAGLAFVHNWMELVDVQTSISTPPTNVKGHAAGTEVGLGVDYTL